MNSKSKQTISLDMKQIFDLQAELDGYIEKEHNLTNQQIWIERKLALLVELAETANEIRSFKFWSLKKPSDRSVILEEYVDGIHFITSLCLFFKVNPKLNITYTKPLENKRDITEEFISLFQAASLIKDAKTAKKWYEKYLSFGLRYGFSLDEIIDAYKAKCKINHQRQVDKY